MTVSECTANSKAASTLFQSGNNRTMQLGKLSLSLNYD